MDGLQEPARSLSSRRRGWQTEEGRWSQNFRCFCNFAQNSFDRETVSIPSTWTRDEEKDKETDKPTDKNTDTHMPILVAIRRGNSD